MKGEDRVDEEQRADEELRLGKYKVFNSVEELIADLHSIGTVFPGLICPWCQLIFYPKSATDIHCISQ